jgi:diguanylate cyclase
VKNNRLKEMTGPVVSFCKQIVQLFTLSSLKNDGSSTVADIPLTIRDYLLIVGWTIACTALAVGITFMLDWNNLAVLHGELLRENIRNDIMIPGSLGLISFGVCFWKIRQLAEAKKMLEKMASTDSLTGVLNRRALQSRIEKALALPGTNMSTLMIIDIDHFKKVNDTYGHDMGDQVLVAVSDAIQHDLLNNEIFGRIGGEEFVLFLTNITPAMATLAAERVRLKVETNPFALFRLEDPLTVSIGISLSTDSQGFAQLYQAADRRLYQAKQLGRNRVVSATSEPAELAVADGANTNTVGVNAQSSAS